MRDFGTGTFDAALDAFGAKDAIKVFAGNSNPALAKAVVQNLGRELSAASVGSFSDGEIQVEIGENIREARSQ